jgi:hypothetical protein
MFAVLWQFNEVHDKKNEETFVYLIHIHLFEAALKNFEILYIFVLQIGLEFHPFQGDTARKEHIHELTIDCSGTQFFDLGE